jgi:hypothetical protein
MIGVSDALEKPERENPVDTASLIFKATFWCEYNFIANLFF